MKKHRIFNKGDRVYALLSSYAEPNIMIPVGGKIVDTKWDPVNPVYKIRILKFFDSLHFIKKHMFDMKFKYEFDGRARLMPLKREDYNVIGDLEKRFLDTDAERFYVIVESIMCTKTKILLKDLFENVQFYIISKNLKEIREISARPFFRDSSLSVDSGYEFDARFKKGWADKFSEPMTIEKYLKSLT